MRGSSSRTVASFGPFQLDVKAGELHFEGQIVRLQEQPFRILRALIDCAGEVVTREELCRALWPDNTVVDFDQSINAGIKKLRIALKDSAEKPVYVETLARRGYRLIVPVEWKELPVLGPQRDAELDVPHDGVRSRRATRVSGTLAVTASLILAGAILRFAISKSSSTPDSAELTQRQLTANSTEDQVRIGAISSDAKYLAYCDLHGIHIKVIQTGETRTVPQPEAFVHSPVNWEIGWWLPDSTGFSVFPDIPHQPMSYWLVSILGGPPRKIRDDLNTWSFSPDGSLVAYTMKEDPNSLGGSEIWLMTPNGENPRKFYDAPDAIFRLVQWSPDGARIAYIREQVGSGRHKLSVESRRIDGGAPSTILSGADLTGFDPLPPSEQEFIWLRDGRILYTVAEPDIRGKTCNLWQIPINTATGRPLAKPKRLTNWAGFCVTGLSQTSDGKRLVFTRETNQLTIYTADYDAGKLRLSVPARLTLTDDWSLPVGWTSDSKTLIILSNRQGGWGFYKQNRNAGMAEPIITGIKDKPSWASISSDGRWILYDARDGDDPRTAAHIMRVPLSGGLPEDTGEARAQAMNCPGSTPSKCVISELTQDNQEVVFSAWEAQGGRENELARIRHRHAENLRWVLSRDGSHIAISDGDASLDILSFSDHSVRHLTLRPASYLEKWTWAADGNGLFVSTPVQQGTRLCYVDLTGRLQTLWKVKGQKVILIPSPAPNAHTIAFAASAGDANIWMMEKF